MSEASNDRSLGALTLAPLQAQFTAAGQAQDLRAWLDALNPHVLARRIVQGKGEALAVWNSAMSWPAKRELEFWTHRATDTSPRLSELWNALDNYDRSGLWKGLAAGFSEEAQIGSAIGSLLGPLGAIAGSALGGWVAGNRVDEDARRGIDEFESLLITWEAAIVADFNNNVVPTLTEPDDRSRHITVDLPSSRFPWATLMVLLAIGGIAFFTAGGLQIGGAMIKPCS